MKKLSIEEIQEKLGPLAQWEYKDGSICKTFHFKDFKETFAVMTRIAFECEAQQHHPDWENVYNTLHIRLNTHDAGGITQNDFALAEIIETVVNS